MPRFAWLTPDTAPTQQMCRSLFFPADEQWLAIVSGCLSLLTNAVNFEQFGSATPEETASVFSTMFDEYSLPPQRNCKMVGEIVLFASSANPQPDNWLPCNGDHISSVDWPDLWAIIGTTFGGTGSTDFAVPDMRDNVPIGTGLSYSVGDAGGESEHVLTVSELASHTHTDAGHVHTTGNSLLLGTSVPPPFDALGPNPIPASTGSGSANIQTTGSDSPHNNLQPFVALQYFIVAA